MFHVVCVVAIHNNSKNTFNCNWCDLDVGRLDMLDVVFHAVTAG